MNDVKGREKVERPDFAWIHVSRNCEANPESRARLVDASVPAGLAPQLRVRPCKIRSLYLLSTLDVLQVIKFTWLSTLFFNWGSKIQSHTQGGESLGMGLHVCIHRQNINYMTPVV